MNVGLTRPKRLLPDWLPIHPHRWWIHTRTVYVPMSYLYGIRFTFPENDLVRALRQVRDCLICSRLNSQPRFSQYYQELYTQDYYSIYWPDQRNNVCKVDLYSPHSKLFDAISVVLSVYEQCTIPPLRNTAVDRAYKLIVYEDDNTEYQTLGPVSKMFNLVARAHAEGPESHAYKMHEIKRQDFMWVGEDGMRMCGTNGSQLWDLGFITQALVETGLAKLDENKESLVSALQWLEQAQMRENPKHYHSSYRHTTKGAWGFRYAVFIMACHFLRLILHTSTKEQGYTVSDCTGEGLKSAIYLQHHLE